MTKAPYIVYTPDEDFVLTKEDINNGGSGGGGGDAQGSDIFWVKFSYNSETGNLDQCDKTYNEIIQAYNSHKIICGYSEMDVYDDNDQLIGTETNDLFYFVGKTGARPEGSLGPVKQGVSFSLIYIHFPTYVEPVSSAQLQLSNIFISENNEIYFNTGTFDLSN